MTMPDREPRRQPIPRDLDLPQTDRVQYHINTMFSAKVGGSYESIAEKVINGLFRNMHRIENWTRRPVPSECAFGVVEKIEYRTGKMVKTIVTECPNPDPDEARERPRVAMSSLYGDKDYWGLNNLYAPSILLSKDELDVVERALEMQKAEAERLQEGK